MNSQKPPINSVEVEKLRNDMRNIVERVIDEKFEQGEFEGTPLKARRVRRAGGVPLFPHLLLPRWCQWLGLLLVMNVVIYLYYFLVPVRSVSLLGPVLTVEEANDQLRRTYPQDSRRLRYYTDK